MVLAIKIVTHQIQGFKAVKMIAGMIFSLWVRIMAKAIYPGFQGGEPLAKVLLSILIATFLGVSFGQFLSSLPLYLVATNLMVTSCLIIVWAAFAGVGMWHENQSPVY